MALPGGEIWHQSVLDVQDVVEENDHFGNAIASGDFNGDGCDDLAVGVEDESFASLQALKGPKISKAPGR